MHGKAPNSKIINGETLKECINCKIFKLLSEFYKNERYFLGCQHVCKQCSAEYSKKRNTKEKNRESKYRKYNITTEDYNNLYKSQDGKCAICLKPFELLHIDHNHISGRVRGLLCNPCNNALGLFKDDIILLQFAIYYLEKDLFNDI